MQPWLPRIHGARSSSRQLHAMRLAPHLSNVFPCLIKVRRMAAMALATLPFQGNIQQLERLPTLPELQQTLQQLLSALDKHQRAHPHMLNLSRLSKRVRRDLAFVSSQQDLIDVAQHQAQPLDPALVPNESRLQGIVNNLRGFHGEMMALHEASGVIAVCKKFSNVRPKAWVDSNSITADSSGSPASQLTAAQRKESNTAIAACQVGQQQLPTPAVTTDNLPSSHQQPCTCSASQDSAAAKQSVANASSQQQQLQQQLKAPNGLTSRQHGCPANMQDLQQPAHAPTPDAGNAAADSNGISGSADLLVEVDVVANHGLTWIEVKNQELFGIESVHWVGSGRCKGLEQQLTDLLAVSTAPCNIRRGRCPQVVLYFPSGVSDEVAAAVEQLGAQVAVGPGSLAALQAPPSLPSVTNLDVTSLCALVSEITWGDVSSAKLRAWACRTVHWQECLAQQQQEPLLPVLHPYLGATQQLVTSCVAVEQFQKLVDMFAGPREQQRWQQLQQRLQTYHSGTCLQQPAPHCCGCCSSNAGTCQVSNNAVQAGVPAVGTKANQPGTSQEILDGCQHTASPINTTPQLVYIEPKHIQRIDKWTAQQKAVFGLGDALQAITLTANGNAVRCAEQYGVTVDAVIHRPVWLTGA